MITLVSFPGHQRDSICFCVFLLAVNQHIQLRVFNINLKVTSTKKQDDMDFLCSFDLLEQKAN